MLVQIAVCRHYVDKIATLTRENDENRYSELNHSTRDVAEMDHTYDHAHDHTYVEIEHGADIKIEDNAAYGSYDKRTYNERRNTSL